MKKGEAHIQLNFHPFYNEDIESMDIGVQYDFYVRWCSCRLTITRRVPLKALCCWIYLYSVLWTIICIKQCHFLKKNLQQDNVQNITIHQIKILNYNLHNPLTIKINLNEKRGSTYSSVLWTIICICSLFHCLSFFDLQLILCPLSVFIWFTTYS
jgi:hypothetical protein